MSDHRITSHINCEKCIAELEAENKAYFVALEGAKAAIIDLSKRAEQAEANWRTQKAATDAMQLDRARIAELQAELAALKSAELSEHRLAREEAEAELAAERIDGQHWVEAVSLRDKMLRLFMLSHVPRLDGEENDEWFDRLRVETEILRARAEEGGE